MESVVRAQAAEGKKIDRRSKRSREAIHAAFRELLSEKDLSQITVTEIAQRANRNRKTFYLHYNAIEDLISELLQEECRYVVDQLEEALRKTRAARTRRSCTRLWVRRCWRTSAATATCCATSTCLRLSRKCARCSRRLLRSGTRWAWRKRLGRTLRCSWRILARVS